MGILSVPYRYPVPLKVAGSGEENLNGIDALLRETRIDALLRETLFTNAPKMDTEDSKSWRVGSGQVARPINICEILDF